MQLAIALVHAWLLENPEHFCKWVQSYVQLRFDKDLGHAVQTRIGGHWRRREGWRDVCRSVRAVCKFQVIARPKRLPPPPRPVRLRWDENGDWIPRAYRVLVWD
jgi:hypothetical protein